MNQKEATQDAPALSSLTDIYRIYHEESAQYVPRAEKAMYEELRGKGDARIYVWGYENGELLLAVSTENGRRYGALTKIAGTQRYNGCVLRFPVSALSAVAEMIHARKKIRLSPEEKQRRAEHMRALHQTRIKNAGHAA